MKTFYVLLFALLSAGPFFAQENFNLELLSHVPFEEDGNDIWGYVDDNGVEYAICGSRTNTRIYSLEDPANPIERLLIPGESSTWRDMKSWNNHVYVTTDVGFDGLLIINMENAPEDITFKFWQPFIEWNGIEGQLASCHNLYIDEFGTVYLSGCGGIGNAGVIMLNIDDPEEPVVVGIQDETYSHDAYAKNNILYSSDILDGDFTIFDVSDKANPVNLGSQITTTDFTHNAWLSDDEQFLFTTDERAGAYVDAYDVSDPNNIIYLDSYRPEEKQDSELVIPHNTHYYKGYLVTSWYTQGLVIIDAHKPDNLVRVAQYDTYLPSQCGSGFCGNWGAFPFFDSDRILVNDINSGLYVFQPTYVRACYLEGKVTDASTGASINGASVELVSSQNLTEATNAAGDYKMGQAEAGTFDVVVKHPLYLERTVQAELINGEVTILDVELQAIPTVSFEGTIRSSTGETISNGVVSVIGDEVSFNINADDAGDFVLAIPAANYQVYAGAWGYNQKGEMVDLAEGTTVDFVLDPGYRDDFIVDLGWEIETTAETGEWVRVVPMEATFGGAASIPGFDVPGDVGDMCYVTGNGSPNSPDDDIDDGHTFLTSDLMDLSSYEEPMLRFDYWFLNDGGFGNPNDQLQVIVRNGADSQVALRIDENVQEWTRVDSLRLSDFVEITETMSIRFRAADDNPGHVIDVSLDAFEIFDGATISNSTDIAEELRIRVRPNPFESNVQIDIDGIQAESIRLFDQLGNQILQRSNTESSFGIDLVDYASGVYYLEVIDTEGSRFVEKLIKF